MNESKEWRFIELCSIGLEEAGLYNEFNEIISRPILNWLEIIHQALRQGLLPLVTYTIVSNSMLEKVPNEFQDLFLNTYLINKRMFNLGYGELSRIIKRFNAENINYVVTKGFSFDSTIYEGNYIRKTNDIDIMIEPKNKSKVFHILESLGYIVGYFNHNTGEIEHISEERKKFYSMMNEFAPEYVIKTGDSIIQCIYVDLNFSLTWFGSKYKVDTRTAIRSNTMIDIPGFYGEKMSIFNLEYQIIYTSLHLFKEAWVEMHGIIYGNDVQLYKFMDILWLLRQYGKKIDIDKLCAIILKFDIEKPMTWVLKHLDQVYGCNYCEQLGYTDISESWLSSWQTIDYKTKYWKGTMKERLKKKDRSDLFLR